MGSWTRRTLRLAFGLSLALGLCLAPTQAASLGGSENCEFRGNKGALAPGDHEGSFFHVSTFQGGAQQLNMKLQLQLKGTIKVEADEQGTIRRANGDASWSLGGAGLPAPIVVAGLNAKATGPLRLTHSGPGWFELSGQLSGGVSVFAKGPTAQGKHGGGAGGELKIRFQIEDGVCDRLNGTFTAEMIDQTVTGFTQQGFTVSRGSQSWSLGKQGSKSAEELADFERRVDAVVAANEAREVSRGKLADLVGEIKKKHAGSALGECMWKIWLRGVHGVSTRWVDEDIPALRQLDGSNLSAIEAKVGEVLSIDRDLVLLGIDTCSGNLHEKIWLGIEHVLEKALDKAYKDKRLVDLISLHRDAELLGVISPALSERVAIRISNLAYKQFQAEFKVLKDLIKADIHNACRPAGQEAIRNALFAEKEYLLLSVANAEPQVPDYVAHALGRLKFKDIQQCVQEERQKNIDKWQKEQAGKP